MLVNLLFVALLAVIAAGLLGLALSVAVSAVLGLDDDDRRS